MKNGISNIDKYRKKPGFNIGVIIFGVAFIYLAANILMFLTNKPTTIYEVREGSIYKDTSYTGLALRRETIVKAERDGYVNYFAAEGTKVGVKSRVYAASNDKLTFAADQADPDSALSDDDKTALYAKVGSFGSQFTAANFEEVYALRETIQNTLDTKSNQSRTSQLDQMVAAGTGGINLYTAAQDGILSYTFDGLETLKSEDVTKDVLEKAGYKKNSLKNNGAVKTGEPVYKIIDDDGWSLQVLLDDDTAAALKDQKSVSVRFTKDGITTRAGLNLKRTTAGTMATLSFHNGMVRYFNDRYIDVELILEDQSGLKIPKSAVTTKQFFVLSDDYLTQGGNSNNTGVLVDTGKNNPEFVTVNIYAKDEDKGLVYIDPAAFDDKAPTLVLPDSTKTHTLSKKEGLKGVYNINKGYAVFRKIDILTTSDDYYIVASGSSYGLKNYDHIALDAAKVKENDVVF